MTDIQTRDLYDVRYTITSRDGKPVSFKYEANGEKPNFKIARKIKQEFRAAAALTDLLFMIETSEIWYHPDWLRRTDMHRDDFRAAHINDFVRME